MKPLKIYFKKFYSWLLWRKRRRYHYSRRFNYVLKNLLFVAFSIVALIYVYYSFETLSFIGWAILLVALYFGIKHSFRLIKESKNWYSRQINLVKIILIFVIIIILFYAYDQRGLISDKFGEINLKDKINFNASLFSLNNKSISDNLKGSTSRDVSLIEAEILSLVNEERQKYKVKPLVSRSNFNKYAREWSDKMISEDFYEHSDLSFAYSYAAGENIGETPIHYDVIGCGQTYTNNAIARCFVTGWINSPGHHENMISNSFSMTGIGVSCDLSKCRATQVFVG